MKIWKQEFTIEGINNFNKNTILEQIGIEFTEYGDDYIIGRMPVDHRTHQPFQLLHGGASGVLAESLGSTAAAFCLEDATKQAVVGTELNCSHLRSVSSGYVYGTCKPIKIGRRMQWWEINIRDEKDRLICVSRLTVAVINR